MSWKNSGWQKRMQVRLDYGNMLVDALGAAQGLKRSDVDGLKPALQRADMNLKRARAEGKLPFYDLPKQTAVAREIQAAARVAHGKFENFVVLGIGGSALGNITLHSALNHPYHNLLSQAQRKGLPRLFVPDNVDPDRLAGLLDVLDLKKTLVNVITKSGDTAETMASFMLLHDRLAKAVGQKNLKRHLIVTTDKEKGNLRQLCRKEGFTSFVVPDGVGGRFSVLTAVGLVSAAFSGIDLDELLAGAAFMDGLCSSPDPWKNPALCLAALLYQAERKQKKPIHVMMPYSHHLADLADWFRQLWAESLGKKLDRKGRAVHVGPTPVKSLGATDQHSQVQLYMEGPFDKVVIFLRVEKFGHEVAIPRIFNGMDGVGYLGGQGFGKLLNAEQSATASALTQNGRANLCLRVPEVNAFTLGQLFMLLEQATAYAGELYDINAFDQPGVEAGKVATYALMGRKGYEAKKADLLKKLKQSGKNII
jgi:glucose-6-phosphate isomerase